MGSVFSFGHAAGLNGEAAIHAFNKVRPPERFTVQSAWTRDDFGFVCSGPLPNFGFGRTDLLVSPQSLEWTMAFTHETDLGPYFSTWGKTGP